MEKSHLIAAAVFLSAQLLGVASAQAQQQISIPVTDYGTISYSQYVAGAGTDGYKWEDFQLGIRGWGGYGYSYYHNYFVFDLSQIPAGDIVTSATFSLLDAVPASFPPGNINLLSSNVTETQIDRAFDQSSLEAVYDGLGSGSYLEENYALSSQYGQTNLIVTANDQFLSLLSGNIGGSLLVGNNGPQNGRYDGGTPTMLVTVVPVPEPAGLAIVTAGSIITLIGARRRKIRGR